MHPIPITRCFGFWYLKGAALIESSLVLDDTAGDKLYLHVFLSIETEHTRTIWLVITSFAISPNISNNVALSSLTHDGFSEEDIVFKMVFSGNFCDEILAGAVMIVKNVSCGFMAVSKNCFGTIYWWYRDFNNCRCTQSNSFVKQASRSIPWSVVVLLLLVSLIIMRSLIMDHGSWLSLLSLVACSLATCDCVSGTSSCCGSCCFLLQLW